ncbi:MAG: malonyl-ACP O-methyltransferase BioC [Rikenellaceae bacterium]|jgi:malonyl-ACP O-methyltransferase BioC|nr:malonyl-ACP O-methyltransferase BioC [Rikenellaceae bacterium]
MNNRDKGLIRARFRKRLASYESQAVIQRQVAGTLAVRFSEMGGGGQIAEIGCGTGFLTREILFRGQTSTLFLNDLVDEAAEGLTEQVRKNRPEITVTAIPGDAEQIVLPGGLDAVVSASTVQWFDDLSRFAQRVAGTLKTGGIFAFSTFGPENLHEIKALTGNGLDYFSTTALRDLLEENFEESEIWEERFSPSFDSPREVLRHLQQTGVTGTGDFRWTKTAMERFEENYRKMYGAGNGRVTLTWHVIFCVCRKR